MKWSIIRLLSFSHVVACEDESLFWIPMHVNCFVRCTMGLLFLVRNIYTCRIVNKIPQPLAGLYFSILMKLVN